MRNIIYFLLLCIAVSFIGLGSINSINGYVSLISIFLLKGVFVYGVVKRQQKKRKQREQNALFNEYMRSQIARNRSF